MEHTYHEGVHPDSPKNAGANMKGADGYYFSVILEING